MRRSRTGSNLSPGQWGWLVGIATLIVLLLFALGFTGWVRASEALGSVFGPLR
jgi:hypothetical protein